MNSPYFHAPFIRIRTLPMTVVVSAAMALLIPPASVWAQAYGPPDRGEPGDEMIQAYLRQETEKIEGDFMKGLTNREAWEAIRPKYKEEYFYMLGLWPMPEKTPLQATVTGHLEGDGFTVDMLHYQSMPHLYVTANLYRPAGLRSGERLPAVLYVCGHSPRGRDGNKTAYQSHGIWFARHGYACLVLDTLQLGEIAGIHHGTYREGRWWWLSRGYTPAGVECWNGMRGLDYLSSRPDVDAERLAVTGISGGGAATFWIAAADERVKAAVPVSGMADLTSYVPNRVINGHCDCMFLDNTFAWPWTRIAALIGPRPLLFVNSDQDTIFPMDANERVINRLEKFYSLFGAGDRVDSLVSIGGHAYRQDIRQAAFRFINTYLKNDPRPVMDSEVDLVIGSDINARHPIAPEKLRVFPSEADIPKDQWNGRIDELFVPVAKVPVPDKMEFASWRAKLLAELRRVTFRYFPERIPPARSVAQPATDRTILETEPGIRVGLKKLTGPDVPESAQQVILVVAGDDSGSLPRGWSPGRQDKDQLVYLLEPRGIGGTRWTRKNPPNTIERSHVLLGRTVEAGRVWDVAAVARYLRQKWGGPKALTIYGEQGAAILTVYAALFEPDISGLVLQDPVLSHIDGKAPPLLNVLRVGDVPDMLGMLAPLPLEMRGRKDEILKKVARIYAAADAVNRLTLP